MPRFTANSTALAAILSVGLGAIPALAEVTLGADAARSEGAARAGAMPLLADLLSKELDAGMDEADLRCLDASSRPCADDMALITPSGVSVQLVEGGGMVLAPAAMQPYAVSAEGVPAPRGGAFDAMAKENLDRVRSNAAAVSPPRAAAAPAAPAPEAKAEAPPAEAAPAAKPAQSLDDALAQELARSGEAPPEPKPFADTKAPTARPVVDPAPPAARPDAAATAAADVQSLQDQLAREIAAAQNQPAAKPEAARPAADSHAGREPRLAAAGAATTEAERVSAMALLNGVLQGEIRAGLTADGLLCKDGSARPCAKGVDLVSPRGVTAEVTDEGRIIIGPMSDQQYIVGEDGQLRARGSNTAAAREAAESVAPVAAALSGEGQGEVVTATVTEADSRSSSEDFRTTISEAVAQATAAQSSSGSRSRDSDLAKLAIAGLGALAVGQMMSGERQVALNTGDRVIVTREDGSQQVLKDDNTLLLRPGSDVRTENFSDGSSRSVVTRADGSQIVTIRAADLTVLRRVHIAANGRETVLIDDSVEVPPVRLSDLPPPQRPATTRAPTTEAELRAALAREAAINRRFTLNQIRTIPEVRNLVAPVDIDAITFDTGSAAINPDQARQLATLGRALEDAIRANPREVFLIEGHTDAVGSATFNLALSDRRAESVALALAEYFAVPPENLVVQGYGEEYLKVPTLAAERQNRRASVRRITDLLATAS